MIILACNLKPERPDAVTSYLKIEGGKGWTPTMYIRLVQDFGLECEVAQHLAKSYGDRAFAVSKMASLTGKRCQSLEIVFIQNSHILTLKYVMEFANMPALQ